MRLEGNLGKEMQFGSVQDIKSKRVTPGGKSGTKLVDSFV